MSVSWWSALIVLAVWLASGAALVAVFNLLGLEFIPATDGAARPMDHPPSDRGPLRFPPPARMAALTAGLSFSPN